MSDKHVERGRVLFEHGRADQAEEEFRRALALTPDDSEAHTWLAACLLRLERLDEAKSSAEQAIGLDPEWSFPQRVLALAELGLGQPKVAERVARAAVELEPEEPSNYSVLAATLADQKHWRDVVEAAEIGLSLDPESGECANLRAFAFVQLGETEHADLGLAAVLQRDPEDADTHANLGWSALRRGDADAAIRHYREALRLEPDSESSRLGLVEALKSRNVIYRAFLSWFLFLTRVPKGTVYILLFASIFARKALFSMAESYPAWSVPLYAAAWSIVAFILMSWIAESLFNLVLRLGRDGRYVLSEDQIRTCNWLGGMLLGAALLGVLSLFAVPAAGMAALMLAALTIPVVRTSDAEKKRKRRFLALYTLGLTALAAGSIYFETKIYSDRERIESQRLEYLEHDAESLQASYEDMSPTEQEEFREFSEYFVVYRDYRKQREFLVSGFVFGFIAFTWIP